MRTAHAISLCTLDNYPRRIVRTHCRQEPARQKSGCTRTCIRLGQQALPAVPARRAVAVLDRCSGESSCGRESFAPMRSTSRSPR